MCYVMSRDGTDYIHERGKDLILLQVSVRKSDFPWIEV